jgi:hypothetical protein
MRYLAIILSVLIIGVSAAPCIDIHQNSENISAAISTDSNNTSEFQIDHCSPFCLCYCCGSVIIDKDIKFNLSIFSPVQELVSEYVSGYFLVLQNTIWQPPKFT